LETSEYNLRGVPVVAFGDGTDTDDERTIQWMILLASRTTHMRTIA
jgi:hypothetical protein